MPIPTPSSADRLLDRRRRSVLVPLCAVITVIGLLCAFAATAARAAKAPVAFWGSQGSALGQFGSTSGVVPRGPAGLAISLDGRVLAADSGNGANRVQRFGPFGGSPALAVAPHASAPLGVAGPSTGQGPHGIAVDPLDGAIYVVDRGNRRVHKFDSAGVFLRQWGWDTVNTGPGNAIEEQAIGIDATDGDFRLTFGASSTGDIDFDAPASTVQNELNALSSIALTTPASSVTVTGGPNGAGGGSSYVVRFTSGALAGTNVGAISVSDGTVPLNGTSTVVTRVDGGAGFEVCVPADGDTCKTTQSPTTGDSGGQFAGTTTAASPFLGHVAVDPVTRNVYVSDPVNRRIQEFTTGGSFIRAIGWGVATGADQLETCTTTYLPTVAGRCQAGFSNSSNGGFGANAPTGVTVGFDRVVYAVDQANNRVIAFPAAAGSAQTVLDGTGTGSGAIQTVSIDAPVGNLFISHRATSDATSEMHVRELEADGSPAPDGLHASGAGIDEGLTSSAPNMSNGLAIHPATGRIYVSITSNSGSPARRIWVLDDAQPAEATIADPPTSAVAQTTATLTGAVDPNGSPTSYRFEYREQGTASWTRVPASDAAVPGATGAGPGTGDDPPVGTSPVTVSQPVTGLTPGATYQVRLVTTKTFGGAPPDTSTIETFTTLTAPPSIGVIAATAAETTATLRGQVNPNGLPTAYYFEYSTDPTFTTSTRAPVGGDGDAGSGARLVTVVEEISGLAPSTTYHYRLVATNDAGPPTTGIAKAFTTNAKPPTPGRAYEMVTPPDKSVRRTGDSQGPDEMISALGWPSADGDSVMHLVRWGVLGEPGGALGDDPSRLVRSGGGWELQPVLNRPISGDPNAALFTLTGANATQSVQSVSSPNLPVFLPEHIGWSEVEAKARYLRFFEGVPSTWAQGPEFARAPGWVSVMSDPLQGTSSPLSDHALFSDDGRYVVRGGRVKGLLGGTDPSWATTAQGSTVYRQDLNDGSLELVSECTGVGPDQTLSPTATLVPERDDSGTPGDAGDDKLVLRPCAAGSLPNVAGAVAGGGSSNDGVGVDDSGFSGPGANAVSSDGRRAFFTSPDPSSPDAPPTATPGCDTATGAASNCQPQLFVRQWNSDGEPTVRWISRPLRWDLDDPGERPAVAALGRGVAYAGASLDGRRVFFVTNAPLVASDPNGGAPVDGAAATASSSSWDVYQYTLPASPDADPASGALTRITGGPTGTSDPNTNDSAGGVRYISRDATKVYFVTRSPIPGAVDSAPAGSGPANTPGSGAATRNLYLYDSTKNGAARWKFVGRLPFSSTGLDACATSFPTHAGPPLASTNQFGSSVPFEVAPSNCVFGEPDGRFVTFMTSAQLTVDDVDTGQDVYVYDATLDKLTRASAPPADATDGSYLCASVGSVQCNADFGFKAQGRSSFKGELTRGASGLRHSNVTADGSVFFESRRRLVPEDVNGSRMDTYQYKDGELSLISPGTSDDDAFYSGSSVDGTSVFFDTTQPLDASREIDAADGDVYVARVGGGFPPPPVAPSICNVLAGGCQGGGVGPASAATRTSSQSGDANASPGVRRKITLRKLTLSQRRRAARTGLLVVSVRTSSAGKVRAVARGRIGKRTRRVARKSVRVREAGASRIELRLSRAARQRLRRGKALKLSIKVTSPGARSRSMTARLPGASS